MFQDQEIKHDPGRRSDVDRRALLQSAGGGAAAAALLGGLAKTIEASPQSSSSRVLQQAAAATYRRVVTGTNSEGKSLIMSDESVSANNLWTTTPERPLGAGPEGEPRRMARARGDSRCFVAAIQPSRDPKPTAVNRVGFHATQGIAYCLILNGEIVFITDLQETTLKAGDILVERNAAHSWRNESDVPVAMLITNVFGVG